MIRSSMILILFWMKIINMPLVEGKTLLRFLADIYGKPKTEDLEYAERTATAEEVISSGRDKEICDRRISGSE